MHYVSAASSFTEKILKLAIMQHQSGAFSTLPRAPIIHLTTGDFKGPQKSTKMLFVCCEKSTQIITTDFFSRLYDGTSKDYPNGIMMLLFLLNLNTTYELTYHQKVIYKHDQYVGEETCMCIHGLQDLNATVKLTDSQEISLGMLLPSLLASQSMSWP